MSIHKFPEGERIDEATVDHSGDLQNMDELSFNNLLENDIPWVSTPDEFSNNLYEGHVKEIFSDPRLKEMPDNILNIKNGSLVKAHMSIPDIGIEEGVSFYLFYDGTGVRLGSLDSEGVWPLEKVIEFINKNKLEYRGDFLNKKSI